MSLILLGALLTEMVVSGDKAEKNVKIYQDLKRKTNFYYIIYSTNDSINFYNKIYNGASIYLDRKKEKFDELVSKRIEYENLIKNKNKLKVLTES